MDFPPREEYPDERLVETNSGSSGESFDLPADLPPFNNEIGQAAAQREVDSGSEFPEAQRNQLERSDRHVEENIGLHYNVQEVARRLPEILAGQESLDQIGDTQILDDEAHKAELDSHNARLAKNIAATATNILNGPEAQWAGDGLELISVQAVQVPETSDEADLQNTGHMVEIPRPEGWDLSGTSNMNIAIMLDVPYESAGPAQEMVVIEQNFMITPDKAFYTGTFMQIENIDTGDPREFSQFESNGRTESADVALLMAAGLRVVSDQLHTYTVQLENSEDDSRGDAVESEPALGNDIPEESERVEAIDGAGDNVGPPDRPDGRFESSPDDPRERRIIRDLAINDTMQALDTALRNLTPDIFSITAARTELSDSIAEAARTAVANTYGISGDLPASLDDIAEPQLDFPDTLTVLENLSNALRLAEGDDEATVKLLFTAGKMGDQISDAAAREWLRKERESLIYNIFNDGHIPEMGDHKILDTVVTEYERWIDVLYGPELRIDKDSEILDLIERYGASEESKWQSFVGHYARRLEQTKNEKSESQTVYRNKLELELQRLMEVDSGQIFSDRFIRHNTLRAIRATDDPELRNRLVENYVKVAGRRHPTELAETEYTLQITNELLQSGYHIPAEDRSALIDAIVSNTPVDEIPHGFNLHAHTKNLIKLNSLASDRSLGPANDNETEMADILDMNGRALQELELRIRAHAGDAMTRIAVSVREHNAVWSKPESTTALIDMDQLLMDMAVQFVRNKEPERAIESIIQMDNRKGEAFVRAWSAVGSEAGALDVLRPPAQNIMQNTQYLAARILRTGNNDRILEQGRIMAASLVDRMSEFSPELRGAVTGYITELYQFNGALSYLSETNYPVARQMALHAIELSGQPDIIYSNHELAQVYRTLIVDPPAGAAVNNDFMAVWQVINNAKDAPEDKAQFLAMLAHHASRQ